MHLLLLQDFRMVCWHEADRRTDRQTDYAGHLENSEQPATSALCFVCLGLEAFQGSQGAKVGRADGADPSELGLVNFHLQDIE